ncbi:hypothetical protein A2U01_0026896, partial [Trifolium medium]|nr:hypothetical protein [Trifolium medium]
AAKGASVGDNFIVSDCDDPTININLGDYSTGIGAHGLCFRSFNEFNKARTGNLC